MEYTNPELPEGINASQEHPLKEFFWLTAGVFAVGFAIILVIILLADTLSVHIPFRIEREYTARYFAAGPVSSEIENYLNTLASRIAHAEKLPDGMDVRIHYLEGDTVNAFATLGGNIYIFRGLLEHLPNENALAMVLAHEIAHIKNRDPIRGVGRAVIIGLALSMVSGDMGDAMLDNTLSQGATLTLLKYSREQERSADDEALDAMLALYGHAEGAAALFEVLEKEHAGEAHIEFFSSHPLTVERIAKVQRAAAQFTSNETHVTALPQAFGNWLKPTSDIKDDVNKAQ